MCGDLACSWEIPAGLAPDRNEASAGRSEVGGGEPKGGAIPPSAQGVPLVLPRAQKKRRMRLLMVRKQPPTTRSRRRRKQLFPARGWDRLGDVDTVHAC